MEPSHSRWATHTGTPDQMEDGVEGAHREQVADVLVRDRPQATVGFHMNATWLRKLSGSR